MCQFLFQTRTRIYHSSEIFLVHFIKNFIDYKTSSFNPPNFVCISWMAKHERILVQATTRPCFLNLNKSEQENFERKLYIFQFKGKIYLNQEIAAPFKNLFYIGIYSFPICLEVSDTYWQSFDHWAVKRGQKASSIFVSP